MPTARSATGSTARSPAAAWAPSSRAATPTSAATWPSRSCATTSATTPTWSAGSSRRRRSAASSSTPASCPIYELGTFADRRPFFAMKLVKGHTLAQLLEARDGPDDDLPRFLVDLRGHRPDGGLRPRPRRDPPRPEAVQRDGRQLRRGAGDGLGAGQGPAPRRRGRRREGRPGRAPGDGHRHGAERLGRPRPVPARLGDGHAGLHGAGAGPRRDRPGRRAGRRLRAGLDPLRGPHRPARLPGPLLRRDPPQGGPGRHWPTPWPGWTPAGPMPSWSRSRGTAWRARRRTGRATPAPWPSGSRPTWPACRTGSAPPSSPAPPRRPAPRRPCARRRGRAAPAPGGSRSGWRPRCWC